MDSSKEPNPGRWSTRIVKLTAHPKRRDQELGDLVEEYREFYEKNGENEANKYAREQARGHVIFFLPRAGHWIAIWIYRAILLAS